MMNAPALWGASLACALGGAIAGNALGSTPPLDRSVLTDFYQTHDMFDGSAPQREPPPDHYPLVTKAGTVPVGELSMRGLYSQRRYLARVYDPGFASSEISVEEYRPGEDWRPEVDAEEPALADEHQTREPVTLAAAPASVAAEGAAKTIDVDAALAMR